VRVHYRITTFMPSRKIFPSLSATLAFVFFAILVLMTVYETAKQVLNPAITIWESHIVTILFTSIIAVIISYFPLRASYHERERAETALRQLQEAQERLDFSRAQYRSFVESVEDSIYTVDSNLCYLLINGRHLARMGLAPEMYLGKPYGNFHSAEETKKFTLLANRVFTNGMLQQDEYEHEGRYFLRKFNPVTDPAGSRVIAVTIISTEITERKESEKKLADTNRKLGLMNEIVRHDILNQITVMNSYLDLATRNSTNPVVQRYLFLSEQSADAISAQIMFARDYQEIGIASPRWQQLGSTIQIARLPLKIPTLDISAECTRVELHADPLFEKVFYNLMENSLRHADASVAIRVSCRGDEAGLAIIYEDNGPGISIEDKQKIFTKGYGKNTGLGLFLIREILATTGISICETGNPGHGVRFEILVPKEKFRYCEPGGCSSPDPGTGKKPVQ